MAQPTEGVNKGFVVYVLEEKNLGKWYIGYTTNLSRRILEHNNHKNFSTRFGKWRLIYAEYYLEKQDALGREKFLKSGSGYKFLKKQLSNYLLINKKQT